MAAVLSSDMDNTDKVVTFIDECRQMKLNIMPPSVNNSEYRFTVDVKDNVIYGLGAIKGVGESAIESLLQQRREQGEFRDLFDLCRRMDGGKVNRRVLESLIRAGACDGFGVNRATLMAQLPDALALAEQTSRDNDSGQTDLFGLPETAVPAAPQAIGEVPDWDEEYRLNEEKKTLGLYLTGHPIERFAPELKKFVSTRLADIAGGTPGYDKSEQSTVIAGLVVAVRTRNGNRGGRMAFVTLDDRSARFEIRVFSEAYEKYRELIVEDQVLIVKGKLSYDDFADDMRLNAEQLLDIDSARNEYARRMVLNLDAHLFGNGLLDDLAGVLAPHRQGNCSIWVDYSRPGARARLNFDDSWCIRPSEGLLKDLRKLVGADKVRLEYR
jgi:DNA polymerase-3 subunit alpha